MAIEKRDVSYGVCNHRESNRDAAQDFKTSDIAAITPARNNQYRPRRPNL